MSAPGSNVGKVITCKAAIAYGPGESLVVEEVQLAPPQKLEVRIQITHSSLCHSDVTFWDVQASALAYPRIYGHEAAGIVESVGEGVTHVQPGDHVLPLFSGECQACRYCKSVKTNLCEHFRVNTRTNGVRTADGHYETRFSLRGKPIFHFLGTSTFSQYTVVSHACVAKINPAAPLDKICLLSCGVATGLGAAWNCAKVHAGASVAIFGLGTIGLAVAEGARVAGASRIIGIDVNPDKEKRAYVFGVTDFVNPNDHDKPIQQVIHELTDGGVDYAFECVGTMDLMRAAYEATHDVSRVLSWFSYKKKKQDVVVAQLSRIRSNVQQQGWGVAVVMGIASPTEHLSFPHKLLFSGRSIKGTIFGDFKGRSDLPDLVEKYLQKGFNLDDFVTHHLPLARINEAFQLMLEGKSLRSVIHMFE